MTKRAEHLAKTEDLLKDQDVTKDAEYTEKYTKEIDILNGMIAKKHQKIKINNETLIKLNNDLFKIEVEINSTKRILEECTKSNPSFMQTRQKLTFARTFPITSVVCITMWTCRRSKGA